MEPFLRVFERKGGRQKLRGVDQPKQKGGCEAFRVRFDNEGQGQTSFQATSSSLFNDILLAKRGAGEREVEMEGTLGSHDHNFLHFGERYGHKNTLS